MTSPDPRRTRSGDVIIGASLWSRARPGIVLGLPVLAVILGPLVGTVLQRRFALYSTAESILALLGGMALAWAGMSLLGLLALALTHPAVRWDQREGTLRRWRGLRPVGRPRSVRDLHFATGEAERSSIGILGFRDGEQWVIAHIAWDDAAFDGLRLLQQQMRTLVAPPRPVLAEQARRQRTEATDRALAERYRMPWKSAYTDHRVFLADFDRVRQELGGKAPTR